MFKQKAAVRQNRPYHLIAPLGGINALSPFFAMKENQALAMENFFPSAEGLRLRPGYLSHALTTGQPERLWVYSTPSGSDRLFATTPSGIYNVTTGGGATTLLVALTEGETSSASISTGAGSYMLIANGVDTVKSYDGTTWSSVATFGALASETLSYVETYRQRVYFVKRNSLELEYLGANSVSGATTNYPLGAIFRRGGYIVALATWTLDSGSGPDDQLAVLTSQGEVAVFSGSLPSDATLWSERGVFYVGKPLGKNPLYKWGGDLLILTENGVLPLSSVIQSTALIRTSAVSNLITPLINKAAELFRDNKGWQLIADPQAPYLLVNIPSTPVRKQFVMNLETKAWSVFSGWDAVAFARMGSLMYFSESTGRIRKITGTYDGAVGGNYPIRGSFVQAPSQFDTPYNKKVELIRPYMQQNGDYRGTLGFGSQLKTPLEYTDFSGRWSQGSLIPPIWGTAFWGIAGWVGASDSEVSDDWLTPPDTYGTWKSLHFAIQGHTANVSYHGSDIRFLTSLGL